MLKGRHFKWEPFHVLPHQIEEVYRTRVEGDAPQVEV